MNGYKTQEELRMEAKLKSRSRFWHLVKRVRELQKKVYQDKNSTKEEYGELKTLLPQLDSILDKAKERLVQLGLLEEEPIENLRGMFGDATKDIRIRHFNARDGYETRKAMYLSISVIIMRQWQIHYQETHKTFIYPILFSWQNAVDAYLDKGELHDQLEMFPKKQQTN